MKEPPYAVLTDDRVPYNIKVVYERIHDTYIVHRTFTVNHHGICHSKCEISVNHIQGVPKKPIPKRYKNKRHKGVLVLHVFACYKDYYIIILGENMI